MFWGLCSNQRGTGSDAFVPLHRLRISALASASRKSHLPSRFLTPSSCKNRPSTRLTPYSNEPREGICRRFQGFTGTSDQREKHAIGGANGDAAKTMQYFCSQRSIFSAVKRSLPFLLALSSPGGPLAFSLWNTGSHGFKIEHDQVAKATTQEVRCSS